VGSSKLRKLCSIPVELILNDNIDALPLGGPSYNMITLDLKLSNLGVCECMSIASILKHAPSLQNLDLSSNHITNVYFSSNQPVFEGCYALAEAISAHPTIQRLDISCCDLTGHLGRHLHGVMALSEGFKGCKPLVHVNMQGNKIPKEVQDRVLLDHAGQAAKEIARRMGRAVEQTISRKYLKAFDPNLLDIFMADGSQD
jgi:Leucine-rich repeat (LRR) protein